MGRQMSQIFPRFCVYKGASLIIHWQCFQVSPLYSAAVVTFLRYLC